MSIELEEPDISFWFDKEDLSLYRVKIRNSLPQICIIQASFDLLARALKDEPETVVGEFLE